MWHVRAAVWLAALRGVAADEDEAAQTCAPMCVESWRNDGACDAPCNVDACDHDGVDCFWDASECWSRDGGQDYRGKVARTASGRECQAWSAQEPWHHTKTVANYPASGLGGHNYCRNPDGDAGGPWCYTLDYPAMRWEYCDVGARSANPCTPEPAHSSLAVGEWQLRNMPTAPAELALDRYTIGRLLELEVRVYVVTLPRSVHAVQAVLLPTSGDADLFLSFTTSMPTRERCAQSGGCYVEESVGAKQLALRAREHEDWCAGAHPPPDDCKLHVAVSGFEAGDFRLVVYNATAGGAHALECAPSCDGARLGDGACDAACNTSACLHDGGDCGYDAMLRPPETCAPGCPLSWLADGECDELCYVASCEWDGYDCAGGSDAGCADYCLPSWIDDAECDEACNNAACGYDGADCDHGAGECYTREDGRDYRGTVAVSRGGYECQPWSHQAPNAHTRTHANYPLAGLGGHNHCRNPRGELEGPWCYTLQPGVRYELCRVGPPAKNCTGRPSQPASYRTLCPVDCARQLGNGRCDLRCNISSCAFDRGDCGVGIDVAADLFAAQLGVAPIGTSRLGHRLLDTPSTYALVGFGVLLGVCAGLAILRHVLMRKEKDELRVRGYTTEERKIDAAREAEL